MDDKSFIPILLAQLDGFEQDNETIREFSEQELGELLRIQECRLGDTDLLSIRNTSDDFSARLIGFGPEVDWLITMSNGDSFHHNFAQGPACLAAKNGFHFAAFTMFNKELVSISKQGTVLNLRWTDNGNIFWVFYQIDPDSELGQKDMLMFNSETHNSTFNGDMLMQSDMERILPTVQHYCDFYLALIADETIAHFMPDIDTLQTHLAINVQMASVQKGICDYFAEWAGELFRLTVACKMETLDPESGHAYFLVLNGANQTFRVSRLDGGGNEIVEYFGNYCELIMCLIIGQFKVEDEHARFDVIQEQYLKIFTKTTPKTEEPVDE